MTTNIQKSKPKFGLCIDWETTGSDWDNPKGSFEKYQGISFGALVFDVDTFEIVEELYREIKFEPSLYSWSSEAEKIHGLSQDYLEKNGVTREDAAVDLAEMILKYFGPEAKIMFMGHNADFDIQFTKQLLNSFDIDFRPHHVKLDTSGTGFITLGLFKSDLLFAKLGFAERGDHNALEDARMTLETCKIIRGLMEFAYSQFYK